MRNTKTRSLNSRVPSKFPQTPDEPAETLLRLERMLTRAEGFALGFVRVNVPTQRVELVKEIRARVELKGIHIFEIDLREPIRDVLTVIVMEIADQLKRLGFDKLNPADFDKLNPADLEVLEKKRYAIFVYGLEHSIPSSETYHPTLAVINYKRENFQDAIHAPLVLWVPEYALQAIMEGAPDFWAWHSNVFEFTAPQETVANHWSAVEPERGQVELSNMSLEEKRNRIQLLSGLLAEYEAREDADSPEIEAIRWELLNRIGNLYYYVGDYNLALEFHQHAHKIAHKSSDKAGLAISLHQIGMIHHARGDYAVALEAYETSLKLVKDLGDYAGVASALNNIGTIHENRGDYASALAAYEKALKLFEKLGNRAGVANALHNIGLIYQDRENYAAALAAYEKVLKLVEELGDRAGVVRSLRNIGAIHQAGGDYKTALKAYETSLKLVEGLGDRVGVASSRGQIGQLFTQLGHYPEAFEHLHFAHVTFAELGSPNAKITANMLKDLRAKWGVENFDAAWQGATGEAVPDELKIED